MWQRKIQQHLKRYCRLAVGDVDVDPFPFAHSVSNWSTQLPHGALVPRVHASNTS